MKVNSLSYLSVPLNLLCIMISFLLWKLLLSVRLLRPGACSFQQCLFSSRGETGLVFNKIYLFFTRTFIWKALINHFIIWCTNVIMALSAVSGRILKQYIFLTFYLQIRYSIVSRWGSTDYYSCTNYVNV